MSIDLVRNNYKKTEKLNNGRPMWYKIEDSNVRAEARDGQEEHRRDETGERKTKNKKQKPTPRLTENLSDK